MLQLLVIFPPVEFSVDSKQLRINWKKYMQSYYLYQVIQKFFAISKRLGIFCFKINTKINSEPLCVMGQITIDNRPVRSPCTLFLYCEMFYFFLSHIFGEEGIYILQAWIAGLEVYLWAKAELMQIYII